MRKVKLFFLSLMLVSLLWTPASEAVTIKGKPLSGIDDIVKTVTSSDFPEIQKHSILLFERFSYNGSTRYRPTIFTISNDGSVRKQHELAGYDINRSTESTAEHFVQKMSLAMPAKRFGQRRTVMLTMPGMHHPNNYEYSVYGFRTIETDGTEDSADISLVNPTDEFGEYGSNRIIWGNAAMTVKGLESKDVFVCLHSSHMAYPGNLYFKFFTSERNETGNVSREDLSVQGEDRLGWKLIDYSDGNRGAGVAAGDFDGDGYKDEVVVCFNDNYRIFTYLYKLTFEGGQASVKKIGHLRIHNTDSRGTPWEREHATPWGDWSMVANRQACPNVVVLDFNGDGKDEAAFVYKGFDANGKKMMEVCIARYDTSINPDGKDPNLYNMDSSTHPVDGERESACKVTKCDFDGDGKDELAILFFEEHDSALWPRLERWYCDDGKTPGEGQSDRKGSPIYPLPDASHKKGGSDTSVLGYSVHGDDYNRYYKIAEDFCITAGPIMGTKGAAKLAEDIVISHVNSDAGKVFVIPTQLDSSGKFAGFGDTKTIYNVSGADSARRGAVITGDFANESLMLSKSSHTVDDHDESYIVVLEAFPYHIDNVDIHGNLTSYPINYTFSGFTGDEGNGEMSVLYSKTQTSTTERDVSFVMASTTETIGLFGDAGPTIHSGLSFASTAANIAGNFDERIKSGAEVFDSIMDFVTDKIDETTTEGTKQTNQRQNTTTMRTDMWDAVYKYSAAQHIWRYKILNRPLPSWYVLGPKADMSSRDLKAESKDQYITFTIYDNAKPISAPSNQTDSYQPLHEEGNFFSYPSDVEAAETYNADGRLIDTEKSATWTKGIQTGEQVTFTKERIESLKYDDKIRRSPLSKLISAIATAFGADDPVKLPPYTSHNETSSKSFSTSEMIDFRLFGRSTEPGEYAGHTLHFIPYLAREGAMMVTMAVTLSKGSVSPLWGSNSLYSKLPDPALLLPGKYKRLGATLVTNDIPGAAMKMRGMRFYVESLDLHSDTDFLAGLTYKIRVPLYNASFLKTGSFDVRLSYAYVGRGEGMFDEERPYDTTQLTHIQTLSGITMGGWSNASSNSNKKWLEFTWKVPENAVTGDCVFYVQIDPGKQLPEVHESRMDSTGRILDSGGNNEGYFNFHITSLEDAQDLIARRKTRASVRASEVLSPRGTIYRVAGRNASGNAEGAVFSSESGIGKISAETTFDTIEGLDLLELLEVFGEGYSNGNSNEDILKANDDETYPLVIHITYEGDEYYPEAYFYGFNYKPGTQNGDFSEVDHSFMEYRMALVPHTTSTLVVNVSKKYMDYINGTGFEIVVPALSDSASIYTVSDDYAGSTGDDTGGDDSGEGGVTPITGIESSSGGCETGTGIFAALIFAGALLFRKQERR